MMLYASKTYSYYEKITENNFGVFKMWEMQNPYVMNAVWKLSCHDPLVLIRFLKNKREKMSSGLYFTSINEYQSH